jgi:hypothetical protein
MLHRIAAGAALAVLAISLAGCTTTPTPAATASPSPSADPAKALAAAVAKTTGINLKVVLAGDTPEEDVIGSYDAAHKIASLAQRSGKEALRIVVTTDEMYLGGLPDFRGKTVRLRIAKLHPDSPLVVFAAVTSPLTLLTAVTGVEATGPTSFSGTLDLTRAQSTLTGARKFLEHAVKAGGTKAKAVAFTASVNGDGYLTEFDATLPGIDEGKDADYLVKLSDFGAPVSVRRPTGKSVVEAPAAMYAQS